MTEEPQPRSAPPVRPHSSIEAEISQVLRVEAHRNEMRLAWVRLSAFGTVFVVTTVLWMLGARELRSVMISAFCGALSVTVYWALRRTPYRRWFPYAIPLLDALLIKSSVDEAMRRTGPIPEVVAICALAAALFCISGALRFDRRSVASTTGLAALILFDVLLPVTEPRELMFPLVGLAGIGLLGIYLTDRVRSSMEAARSRVFLGHFLPRALLDGADRDPLSIITTPKSADATIIVSDLRGFTSIAERLQPGDVLALLNEFQGELAAAVREHGGTVDKFMGDGMLAVFGAPEPLENHAARAIAAARSMLDRIDQLNVNNPDRPPLRLGIGIHSGRVVVGCLGSGERLEFTVIGDAVNTASRLEAMTKELGVAVVIGEETVRQAAADDLSALGEVSLRGRNRPLPVYTFPQEAERRRAAVA